MAFDRRTNWRGRRCGGSGAEPGALLQPCVAIPRDRGPHVGTDGRAECPVCRRILGVHYLNGRLRPHQEERSA